MSIVDKIQKLCDSKNMNLANLQKELGFGNGTIYRWDRSSPSVDKLQKVANYFDVTIDYLLDDSEDELIIPDELKGVKVAFHRGAFEDLTQDEVNALAVIARTLKSQRIGRKNNDKT